MAKWWSFWELQFKLGWPWQRSPQQPWKTTDLTFCCLISYVLSAMRWTAKSGKQEISVYWVTLSWFCNELGWGMGGRREYRNCCSTTDKAHVQPKLFEMYVLQRNWSVRIFYVCLGFSRPNQLVNSHVKLVSSPIQTLWAC